MKQIIFLILASLLVLGACGQKEESKSDNQKRETAEKDKEKVRKEEKSNEESDDKSTNNNENTKQISNDINNSPKETNKPQIDVSNITDRNTLEAVLNGNYSEEEKILAYNSAVANGVIPQGNVMEGPASAAYESSLRVENGTEKSVYEQQPERKDYENNGVYRTAEEQKAHEDWVNGQQEWLDEQKAKEDKLQKEYFDLSDKMYQDGVSESDYNAMEKRQNEILDQVEPIN